MSLKSLSPAAFMFAGMLLLASCANTAHIEKSKGTDLAKYKTYNWVEEEKQPENKSNRGNEIIQQNIQAAVDDQLQKSGWQKVKSNPDVLVSTDIVVEKNQKKQKN